MIRSMTGYGAAEKALPDGRVLRVEARTVNHRHLSASVRMPQGWESLDGSVLERARERLSRGRVSVSVSCTGPDGASGGASSGAAGRATSSPVGVLELDLERARRYVSLLNDAAAELGVTGRLDVAALAALPGVFRVEKAAAQLPAEDALLECADRALDELVAMREAEGGRLETALRASLDRIAAHMDAVEALAPKRLLRERDRLRERVRVLADSVDVDEERLAREVAYLAERWDVAEEVVRLRSHVALFLESVEAGGRAGKRLGFVVQEMNREANTIGAKANDAAIAAAAVAVKEELEQLREQLENVE